MSHADDSAAALNAHFADTSFLYGANAAWLEHLAATAAAGGAVPDDLRAVLAALSDSSTAGATAPKARIAPMTDAYSAALAAAPEPVAPALSAGKKGAQAPAAAPTTDNAATSRQAALDTLRALMLIRAYCLCGHLSANLDPLQLNAHTPHPDLDPATYGFAAGDEDRPIFIGQELGPETLTLRQIIAHLQQAYCGTLSVEFMHLNDLEQRQWIYRRIEQAHPDSAISDDDRRAIAHKLYAAEGFEKFLHVKYTGTKRFGLDGAESVMPALEEIIAVAGRAGVSEIVYGMPHRGRLNVLTGLLGKPYRALLNEFQGGSANPDDVQGSGDVKYHLGASSDRVVDGRTIHLTLLANPSHLEAVNPVVLGKARAKQDAYPDPRTSVLPVLLHGDAAFAGQGVVAECFACSALEGYAVGGTVHVVVNNQIGFTTAPHYSRSAPHPSDMAKSVQAPVFHVNGDDPEAVVKAARLAALFRQTFAKDVVLDVVCYRRFGHNEGDEPGFTQPLMYERIRNRRTVSDLYAEALAQKGVLSLEQSTAVREAFKAQMEVEFTAAQSYKPNKADWLDGKWARMTHGTFGDSSEPVTGVAADTLRTLSAQINTVPADFNLHKTVRRVLDARSAAVNNNAGIDWALAEALAFASLLDEGRRVRLSGQDCGRGTFSQRHARLIDQTTEARCEPLQNIGNGRFEVIDSFLSEYAVLGFEYGYSWENPDHLVLWEAQFGDFSNGAQIIIDQFIASAETKWLRMSGLVLLLPHGYEGQGPEHSSARLERYLQLCAEDNMQVINCSSPANYFHALRRQLHRTFRKPLVVMTPKSLLRHKLCVSTLDDLSTGTAFRPLLPDLLEVPELAAAVGGAPLAPDADIRRLVLASGKVTLDLTEARAKAGIRDVYIARLEQIYPFPAAQVRALHARFPHAEVVWCQEEPHNMGARSFVEPHIEAATGKRPQYVGRPAAASTATGSAYKHKAEQEKLLHEALTISKAAATVSAA